MKPPLDETMAPPVSEARTFDPLELLTVAEVAALMKRSPRFVHALVRQGTLQPVQLGPKRTPGRMGRKEYRFTRAALAACLEANTPAPVPNIPAHERLPKEPRPRPALGYVPGRGLPCWDGKRRA